MKWLNLGAIRFIGLRIFQITAYASMILNFMGVKGGVLSVLLLSSIGLIYALVDYFKIIRQEQEFAFSKNPRLVTMERKIEDIWGKL